MRRRMNESEVTFHAEDYEMDFLKKAVSQLPFKKMGLELYNVMMNYTCKRGTMNSVIIRPDNKHLQSIWIPESAKNIHSTEDYQGFTYRGVDYFIYRRPMNHIKKVFVS